MTIQRDIPGDHPIELADLGADVLRQLAQIGETIEWFRPAPTVPVPAGWEICDGHQVLAANHDFGTGANFNTPDLRGKMILGANLATGDGQPGRAAGDPLDPTLVLPGSAPGIGGVGGANTVNVQHAHAVDDHTHPIANDGLHSHVVNNHSHSLNGHTHDVAMQIAKLSGTGTSSPEPLYLMDPSDSRLDDAPGDTHFWKNASGNRHSVRLDPGAGVSHGTVQDRDGATAMDVYEQTSTGPSTGNTGNAAPGTGNAGTHSHGGATLPAAPATDQQGTPTQENRPAYYGLLHIMKVKRS